MIFRMAPRLNVEKVLKKKGVSKRKFSQLLGIEYRNVFRLLRKDSDPRFTTLKKWAKVLNCKVCDLIEED